jgi:hypothetical protein
MKRALVIKGDASMKQNIIYVGLDAGDVQHHGSAMDRQTEEALALQTPGNAPANRSD